MIELLTASSRTAVNYTAMTPFVGTMIAICVLVYIGELISKNHFWVQKLSMYYPLASKEPWRWVTSLFAHAISPMHLICNMITLYQLGPELEKMLGIQTFAPLYFAARLGGNLLFYVWTKSKATPIHAVGASGAIYGLMGAYCVVSLVFGGNLTSLISAFIPAIIMNFLKGVCWQGHLGGFLSGGAVMHLLMSAVRYNCNC